MKLKKLYSNINYNKILNFFRNIFNVYTDLKKLYLIIFCEVIFNFHIIFLIIFLNFIRFINYYSK